MTPAPIPSPPRISSRTAVRVGTRSRWRMLPKRKRPRLRRSHRPTFRTLRIRPRLRHDARRMTIRRRLRSGRLPQAARSTRPRASRNTALAATAARHRGRRWPRRRRHQPGLRRGRTVHLRPRDRARDLPDLRVQRPAHRPGRRRRRVARERRLRVRRPRDVLHADRHRRRRRRRAARSSSTTRSATRRPVSPVSGSPTSSVRRDQHARRRQRGQRGGQRRDAGPASSPRRWATTSCTGPSRSRTSPPARRRSCA